MTLARLCILAAALWAFSASWSAAAELTAIVGATLMHPERSGPNIADAQMTILLSGERISKVGPSKSIAVPPGAKVIDATGKWVIPDLIDAHVHFFQSGNPYTRPDAIDARALVPYT